MMVVMIEVPIAIMILNRRPKQCSLAVTVTLSLTFYFPHVRRTVLLSWGLEDVSPGCRRSNPPAALIYWADRVLELAWLHDTFIDQQQFITSAYWWLPSILWDFSIVKHIPEVELSEFRRNARRREGAEGFRAFIAECPIEDLREALVKWFLQNCPWVLKEEVVSKGKGISYLPLLLLRFMSAKHQDNLQVHCTTYIMM